MISCIIFSRDRAMQLDATLRSFFLHCRDAAETARLTVLYKASAARHQAQYRHLQAAYPGVHFVAERDFHADLLELLNPYPAESTAGSRYRSLSAVSALGFRPGSLPDDLIRLLFDPARFGLVRRLFSGHPAPGFLLFLVDDNLFVQDFSLSDCLDALNQHPDALGFSLRLGDNTLYNYMTKAPQPAPRFETASASALKFPWPGASLDFGYPLEVSSSIYRLSALLPILLSVAFRNPNALEAALALRASFYRHSHPALLCFERSVTFCNPLNMVQTQQSNRAGNHYSAEELSGRFERGERVDVAAWAGFIPNACHQEVEVRFISPESA